jgi:hypothetical protein
MNGGSGGSFVSYRYRSYGLTIETPFACDGWERADGNAKVDVVALDGVVADRLPSATVSDPRFDAAPGLFLHRGGPRAGRFLVQGGDRVVVQRHASADEAVLAKQFGACAVPAVMRHRGLLVMHATGAVLDETAVLIGGQSGAGKSTTLAALLKRGFRMLSDDVSVVRFGENHGLEVLPGPARMRLTERAAAGLGIDVANDAGSFLGPRRKRAVPTEQSMGTAAAPLRALFILRTGSSERVTMTTLAGTEKLHAVLACVCGPLLEDDRRQLFPLLGGVLERVPGFELIRPGDSWSAEEVADRVLGAVSACRR